MLKASLVEGRRLQGASDWRMAAPANPADEDISRWKAGSAGRQLGDF